MISDPEAELEKLSLQGALEAHARDELGISETLTARPQRPAIYLG
ncbi:hypothetical protein [Synechococcus lacustris]|nr:hypothetical protein [Synechococcus lacustris]